MLERKMLCRSDDLANNVNKVASCRPKPILDRLFAVNGQSQ